MTSSRPITSDKLLGTYTPYLEIVSEVFCELDQLFLQLLNLSVPLRHLLLQSMQLFLQSNCRYMSSLYRKADGKVPSRVQHPSYKTEVHVSPCAKKLCKIAKE